MDEYIEIGWKLGVLPAIATFIGGWWYCAATYGFLLGFGLGWLPSMILAAMVELAITLLWGPTLALVIVGAFIYYFDKKENKAQHDEVPVTLVNTPKAEPDYSKMSDEELLSLLTAECGVMSYKKMSLQELKRVAAECTR